MKRFLGALTLFAMIGAAFAQAPFTIVSPRNYNPDTNLPLSREKVVLKFPKGSMPKDSYVGIYMGATRGDHVENEQFVEATILPLQGNYYVYTLDTKARQIPDGMYTVRAVLYVDYTDRPREVSTTQVNVRVANQSSIKIPASGLSIHYGFRSGQEWIYRVETRRSVSTISGTNNLNGGRPAELPLESVVTRMVYAIDGSYSDGGAIVRMQALPLPGKDYLYVPTSGDQGLDKFYSYEMAPIYMRVTNTGREIFGAVPDAYGSSEFVPVPPSETQNRLWANFPLPSLPSKLVKPGDSWQSIFYEGIDNFAESRTLDHFVTKHQARGEFLGVEFEHGHPCARIHNTVAFGTGNPVPTAGGTAPAIADNKLSVDEMVWYALDTRKVIKIIRTQTVETKVENGGSGFGAAGSGAPGPGKGGGGLSAPIGSPGARGDWTGNLNQRSPGGRPGQGPAGRPGQAGVGVGPATSPGGFPGSGRGANAPGASAQYYRYTSQEIFTLEE